METDSRPSSPQPGPTQDASTPQTDRRKSGRATRKPELYSQRYGADEGAVPGGSKRKRATPGDDNEEADDASGSENDESNDDEPDAEELREKKRAARRAAAKKTASGAKAKPKSRSSKKPKVTTENGIGSQLAFRPATANGRKAASRSRKPVVRPSLVAGEKGLYGMLPPM